MMKLILLIPLYYDYSRIVDKKRNIRNKLSLRLCGVHCAKERLYAESVMPDSTICTIPSSVLLSFPVQALYPVS